jgi:glycosyltransferase involved in cell wall biosynthesis
MKVAVISTPVFPCPPPGYSGLEHLAWITARGLARKGHQVTLMAPEGSHFPEGKLITTGKPGNWNEKKAFEFYWQQLPSFDVIIDETWNKWSYVMKRDTKFKTPVLGVMHAPVNTMYNNPPPVEKPCLVCISKDQAAHLEALHGWKAQVAYNGVDVEFYKPMGVRRTDRFLFLARFSSIKGADIAIEACLIAGVGLDLVGDTTITGEQEHFNKCLQLARNQSKDWDTSKGPQIQIHGNATRSECVHWFSKAFAMVHPNQRFREPFGLAPVESMLCECPVIAWDNGAMRETVKDGVTGRLVRTLDELVNTIKYAAFKEPVYGHAADTWRKDCREWAAQFSIGNMIDRYEALCKEAIETGGW